MHLVGTSVGFRKGRNFEFEIIIIESQYIFAHIVVAFALGMENNESEGKNNRLFHSISRCVKRISSDKFDGN